MSGPPSAFEFNRIVRGDAREVLPELPGESVDLSFWSPPYFVGKSYEKDLSFEDWKTLLRDVIACHKPILRPGGFVVINIGDILCFPDPSIPRFKADSLQGKRAPVTAGQALRLRAEHPQASLKVLASMLGCSEQTVQRRLEGNNARGGKHAPSTRLLLTGEMLVRHAADAGLYLYDQRIWHKDPCWATGRWHTTSYRAIDEFEHLYVFWNPGVTEHDRSRLDPGEWAAWGSRGVWKIASVRRNDRHPAEFPEMLAERIIRLFSPARGVVIDPFVGSGTTVAVAKRLGRLWFGVEASERYARVAKQRMAAAAFI